MKKLFLILILALSIASFVGCKSKSTKKNPDSDIDIEQDTFVPGDDFDFMAPVGYNYNNLGGVVTVTPKELLTLYMRYHLDFLNMIADVNNAWPYSITVQLRTSAGGSSVVTANMSTNDVQQVPAAITNFILNSDAGDFYLAACSGGYGNTKCSGEGKIRYLGQDDSQYFSSAPSSVQANVGCTSVSFKLSGYNSLGYVWSNGYLSQVEVYRGLNLFSDPDEATYNEGHYIDYGGSYCPSSSYCYVSVFGLNYTNPGYFAIRVRDIDGKLSPMSEPVDCSQ